MKKILPLCLLLLVFSLSLNAQRTCGSHDLLMEQLQQDSSLQDRIDEMNQHAADYERSAAIGRSANIITIPVVFHIVHNGQAIGTGENIDDALIHAQLDQMNADFAFTNSDANLIPSMFQPLAANTMIQFCLAERTPDCTATNGINRINGGQADWTVTQIRNNLQPSTIWNRDEYLNIWTVRFNASNNLLGFAQFPGGSPSTDGVVNAFYTIGSLAMPNPNSATYGLGRTMTHEVGHWLNLRHIWGDATCGDDQVSDTPIHESENFGCPSHPKTNTCDTPNPTEMFMNYMDYVNDNCMHMFSQGQATRMMAVLDGGARASIATSEGCLPPSISCLYCAASANSTLFEKISRVEFSDIDNSSSATAGYEKFTGITGTVTANSQQPLKVSLSSGVNTNQVLAWIDFNQDGDFTDLGEQVYTSPMGVGPHSGTISIPSTATLGVTRMRIRLHDSDVNFNPNATPCGNSDFGQVEDYSLRIDAALPVELTHFEVRKQNGSDALLSWATAWEENNFGFEVEMAKGERGAFQKIGFVAAKEEQEYDFLVNNLEDGLFYFRLRQVDFNGQFDYSPIRALRVSEQSSIAKIYPNPASDELLFSLPHRLQKEASVRLLNTQGQLLTTFPLSANEQQLQIPTANLPTGVYYLQLKSETLQGSWRFVVKH